MRAAPFGAAGYPYEARAYGRIAFRGARQAPLATTTPTDHSKPAMTKHPDTFDVFQSDRAAGDRACDWPGCTASGSHRAPKSRDQLREYFWFCLEHIRPYNKAWNFYEGMTDDQVEACVRSDTTWNRPTWPLGASNGAKSNTGRGRRIEDFDDPFGIFDGVPRREVNKTRRTAKERRALSILELEDPIDAATVKARYKALVKQHHPDANGGDKASEEKFKEITIAYETVMASISP
jgi:hypothetical protein